MGLGTDHITRTTAANFIPELWVPDLIRATESALVMAPTVRDYSALARQQGGDTLHIPHISNMSANTIAASAEVTLQATTETKTDLAIGTHKEASYVINDFARVQSAYDLRSEYAAKAGYAVAKALDTSLLGLYSGISNEVTGGATVDFANVLAAKAYLDAADVPEDDRWLVLNTDAYNDLLVETKLISSDYAQYSMAPVQSGRNVPMIAGFNVLKSTNVATATVSGATQYKCLAYHRDAFMMAVQIGPRIQANYIPERLGTLVTADILYGVAVRRASHAVVITNT